MYIKLKGAKMSAWKQMITFLLVFKVGGANASQI